MILSLNICETFQDNFLDIKKFQKIIGHWILC